MYKKQDLELQIWTKSNPLSLYSRSDKYICSVRSGKHGTWRTMERGSTYCTKCNEQNHAEGKKKCKKETWSSEEALQIAEERESKGKKETERYT